MDTDESMESGPPDKQEELPTVRYSRPRLEPGSQLGKFLVERQLGHGGVGVVYLAQDTMLGRLVAIKSIAPEIMNHPEVLRQHRLSRVRCVVCA